MDTYREGQPCPKCGDINLAVRFMKGDATANPPIPDKLEIKCTKCDYVGFYSPLDSTPN